MTDPIWQSDAGTIYLGNTLDVLKHLPDKSVHCCVTSPPYWGLRDYGIEPQIWDECSLCCKHIWGNENIRRMTGGTEKSTLGELSGGHFISPEHRKLSIETSKYEASQGQFCQLCGAWRGSLGLEPTPELYVKHIVDIFREVKRVLRSDGTLWLNLGDSYASSGSGNNGNEGYNDGRKNRTLRLGGRSVPNLKPKDLCGIPWRVAFALQADGWYLRSDIIWKKPNPMPESCTDRPTKSHEYLFLMSKNQKYYYDSDAIREPHTRIWKENIGGNLSSGYHKKGGKYIDEERKTPLPNKLGRNKRSVWTIPEGETDIDTLLAHVEIALDEGIITKSDILPLFPTGQKIDVWKIPTAPFPEAHFATFPEKLIEPCILAGTSEKGCCVKCGAPWEREVEKPIPPKEVRTHTRGGIGDFRDGTGFNLDSIKYGSGQKLQKWLNKNPPKTIGWQPTCKFQPNRCTVRPKVFDPFFGAGTTGIVAYKHNRKFIGIDLSETYLKDIAILRIEKETQQLKLFK